MAKVPNGVEKLQKISTGWVGCTNVTDNRRQTDALQHIANVNMSSRSLKTLKRLAKFGMGDYIGDMTPHSKIQSGASRKLGEISFIAWFLVFSFFDPTFCSHSETKPENRFSRCLIHRMSFPCYCIPTGIKLPKVSDFPIFTPKTPPNGAWIGTFKPNAQNIIISILSKILDRFQPNFAQ